MSVDDEIRPRRDQVLFFGCYGQSGPFFYKPGMKSAGHYQRIIDTLPWEHVDSALAPRERDSRSAPEMPQGVASLHHERTDVNWTALSFWDRTGDRRGNSNSTFIAIGTHDFETMVATAHRHFPEVMARLDAAGVVVRPVPTPRTSRSGRTASPEAPEVPDSGRVVTGGETT